MAKENGGPITPPVNSNQLGASGVPLGVGAVQTAALAQLATISPDVQQQLLLLLQKQTAVSELDYQIKMREQEAFEKKKEEQKQQTLLVVENAKADEARRKQSQRGCAHTKPNNTPNTICMTSPGKKIYMCLGCQKIWETKGLDLDRPVDDDGILLPGYLVPNEDRTGGI